MIKPPKLEGYSVSKAAEGPADETRLAAATEGLTDTQVPRFQITLKGENFVERAMMLIIRIGDVQVSEYSVSPDQKTIVCFMDELPPEGSVISVGYGPGQTVELPERFSRAKLEG
jgi:hypothetical protein